MEFEFSEETLEMLYETLCNIELAITRLQERTVQVHSADDFDPLKKAIQHFKKDLFKEV